MKATKKTRYEISLLAVLLLVLALVARYALRSQTSEVAGVYADNSQFHPLNVPDPSLRLDLLARMQKEKFNGQDRNIFSAAPLPPSPAQIEAQKAAQQAAQQAPPPVPAGPPPLTVPANFYGIVTDLATGHRRACFSANADDVYIVPEGGTLMNQFRVVKIGSNSVELQELSTGRTTTLVLANAPDMPVNPQQAQN
ncbi:MAG TPA: hypothetical protein VKS20_09465 [Candidatus Acidoferrales bacterium]|nr:hypothetical protein [Candidatus Acidoferrales bacterium]